MAKLVKMDSRGRVTLPRSLRTALKITPRDRLAFSQLADGTIIVRIKRRRLSELGGMLTRPNQPTVTIEEMSS
jgi:bifunctional DNA-binding transcriptional regulator/antitoxin component of YhaV-PrlF toxin-antitoxin module